MAEGDGPQRPAEVDPDDTAGCPVAPACDSCSSTEDLAVGSAESVLGIFCVTLCGVCAEDGIVPSIRSWIEAFARVYDHAEHLGCSVEDLAVSRTPGGAL